MALEPKELYGAEVPVLPNLRAYPHEGGIKPGTLAALSGAPVLPNLTPLSWNDGTELWNVWDDAGATLETYVITAASTTATDGTFTLTLDGEETAAIDHDAAAAAIVSALEALAGVEVGDVRVTDAGGGLASNNGTATIVLQPAYVGAGALSADFALLVGNAHTIANTVEAGGGTASQIDGFLWKPDSEGQATSATGEVLVQVFRRGQIHASDVPLPTTASQVQGNLTDALKEQRLRMLGIDVVGLAGVH
jgi:hypothetical protein